MNTSAVSLIDVAGLKLINTVLLDNIDAGAANPWAVAWSADGKTIAITHAGTHELSVIDFPALLAKLDKITAPDGTQKVDYTAASRTAADVPNDLSFLVGLRQRIKLAPPTAARAPSLSPVRACGWPITSAIRSLSSISPPPARFPSPSSLVLTWR